MRLINNDPIIQLRNIIRTVRSTSRGNVILVLCFIDEFDNILVLFGIRKRVGVGLGKSDFIIMIYSSSSVYT